MTGIWNGTFREPAYWTHFGNRLVHHAQMAAGARVLDGGTGAGAVLLPAADAIGRRGYVVGIDIWGPCVTATMSAIRSFRAAESGVVSVACGLRSQSH